MLAGGDLPDIITKSSISSIVVKENIDAGLIVALNDYIDYMPNYMALLERNAGIKELAYYSDGTLGGFVRDYNYAYKPVYDLSTVVGCPEPGNAGNDGRTLQCVGGL